MKMPEIRAMAKSLNLLLAENGKLKTKELLISEINNFQNKNIINDTTK